LQENGVICALSDGLRRIVTFLIIAFTSFLPYSLSCTDFSWANLRS